MEKDREKPFIPPEPLAQLPPRDDVRAAASPVRCPYCHEDVRPDSRDWVACRACLARHHQGCWNESNACASCRGTEKLVGAPAAPKPRSRVPLAVAAVLAVVAVFVLLGIAGGTVVLLRARRMAAEERA